MRTTCYGLCPAYDLKIFGDGLVVYSGVAHVRVRGQHKKNIGSDVASGLVAELLGSGFLSWKNNYETPGPDLAAAEITLTVGATKKRIEDYGAGESKMYGTDVEIRKHLEALERRVDAVAQSAEWVVCPDEDEGRCRTF